MRVDRRGADIDVTRRWFSFGSVLLVLIAAALLGILAYAALTSDGDMPLMQGLAPLIVLAAGVALGYHGLAGVLNTTHVTISGDELTVRHAPLPWFGVRGIPTADIKQLCCVEDPGLVFGQGPMIYRLHALRSGGRQSNLLAVHDSRHALFIERVIEQHLGIEDREVQGEMRRR